MCTVLHTRHLLSSQHSISRHTLLSRGEAELRGDSPDKCVRTRGSTRRCVATNDLGPRKPSPRRQVDRACSQLLVTAAEKDKALHVRDVSIDEAVFDTRGTEKKVTEQSAT